MKAESFHDEWEDGSMATVAVPTWASGRTFQVWDYTPSHRTLLARCPGGGPAGDNIDIRFTGVRRVDLETKFEIHEVQRFPEAAAGALRLFRFLLIGSSGYGCVVAEELTFDQNSNALFEGLPDASARTFEDAKRLELAVFTVLESQFPEATVSSNQPGRPDFEVAIGERRAFIEVIRSNEDPVERQVRRLVMNRVPRWDATAVRNAPLVVVIGGLRPESLVKALPAHLTTGLGHPNIDAVVWDDFGPKTLGRKLENFLRPTTPGASAFQVFQDSAGNFRWRLKATNGEIIATGESFATHQGALKAIAAVSRAARAADHEE